MQTTFTRLLGLRHPIVQAPMAGANATPPALVAAVAHAGGLGFIGAAYMSPSDIAENCRSVRAKTDRPFGINLFLPTPVPPVPSPESTARNLVAAYHAELGIPAPTPPVSPTLNFDEQLEAVLACGPRVFSDVDAIVARGSEAGAHRGTFAAPFDESMIGTMALVPQIVDAVRMPVLASGGIMDGRGIGDGSDPRDAHQNGERTVSQRTVRRTGMRTVAFVACCMALGVAGSLGAQSSKIARLPPVLGRAEQIVVVTTPGWDSLAGTLRRFARPSSKASWRAVGNAVPIVVGRTGLAWGVGFDDVGHSLDPEAPHKYEGDGRSPAGVFPLDTLFGFAARDSTPWARLPYTQLLPSSDCVDDTASAHYNTVVRRDDVPRIDWASAEHMRTVGQYRIGVVVSYNAAPPVKGRGSCIFLHIWAGPRSTTAGCTALDADQLQIVGAWLDERRRPALVQLPAREYQRLKKNWALP